MGWSEVAQSGVFGSTGQLNAHMLSCGKKDSAICLDCELWSLLSPGWLVFPVGRFRWWELLMKGCGSLNFFGAEGSISFVARLRDRQARGRQGYEREDWLAMSARR